MLAIGSEEVASYVGNPVLRGTEMGYVAIGTGGVNVTVFSDRLSPEVRAWFAKAGGIIMVNHKGCGVITRNLSHPDRGNAVVRGAHPSSHMSNYGLAIRWGFKRLPPHVNLDYGSGHRVYFELELDAADDNIDIHMARVEEYTVRQRNTKKKVYVASRPADPEPAAFVDVAPPADPERALLDVRNMVRTLNQLRKELNGEVTFSVTAEGNIRLRVEME